MDVDPPFFFFSISGLSFGWLTYRDECTYISMSLLSYTPYFPHTTVSKPAYLFSSFFFCLKSVFFWYFFAGRSSMVSAGGPVVGGNQVKTINPEVGQTHVSKSVRERNISYRIQDFCDSGRLNLTWDINSLQNTSQKSEWWQAICYAPHLQNDDKW